MENPPMWNRSQARKWLNGQLQKMNICVKPFSLFLVFHFYEAWKTRNCASECHFFVLLNDLEKDIKVLSIVRSRGFFAPKKVNAHGLSNFIGSGKNLSKTRFLWSRGFNEPKKVNAHGLSNFRDFGKNLRKTPTWRFFIIGPEGLKKS